MKILESTNKQVLQCKSCNCKFEYDTEDILIGEIWIFRVRVLICPCCKEQIILH